MQKYTMATLGASPIDEVRLYTNDGLLLLRLFEELTGMVRQLVVANGHRYDRRADRLICPMREEDNWARACRQGGQRTHRQIAAGSCANAGCRRTGWNSPQ